MNMNVHLTGFLSMFLCDTYTMIRNSTSFPANSLQGVCGEIC